jgi:hypothetical protein
MTLKNVLNKRAKHPFCQLEFQDQSLGHKSLLGLKHRQDTIESRLYNILLCQLLVHMCKEAKQSLVQQLLH